MQNTTQADVMFYTAWKSRANCIIVYVAVASMGPTRTCTVTVALPQTPWSCRTQGYMCELVCVSCDRIEVSDVC